MGIVSAYTTVVHVFKVITILKNITFEAGILTSTHRLLT